VPVLGDVFDVWYRANDRNVALLRGHLEEKLQIPKPHRQRRFWWLLVVVTGVALLLLGYGVVSSV